MAEEPPQEAPGATADHQAEQTTSAPEDSLERDWRPAALKALRGRAGEGDPKAIRLLIELEDESLTSPAVQRWQRLADSYARELHRVCEGYDLPTEPGDILEWSRLRARVQYLENQLGDLVAKESRATDALNQLQSLQEAVKTWQCRKCGYRPAEDPAQ